VAVEIFLDLLQMSSLQLRLCVSYFLLFPHNKIKLSNFAKLQFFDYRLL
jgi:hypothetical protein